MGGETGGIIQGVIGVVLIVVGALATPVGWGLIAMGASMLIGGVASYTAESQAKKAGRWNNSQIIEQGGHLINTRSTQEPIRLIYGRMKVGGNIVYESASGANNEYLHLIITLGEGEMDACEQVWLDDKPIADYGATAYYEFYNGGANQNMCAALNAADPNWTDPLRHTAYLYVRLKYDTNKYMNQPTATALIRGSKLFDPRSGLTAWSQNPALVFYDLFTQKRYAFGFSSILLDTSSIIDSANWCDTNSYEINGGVFSQDAALNVIEQMLLNFRGVTVYNAAKYKLKVLDYESPVMSLTEDDIRADSFGISVPGLPETPNRTRVKFPNKDNGYNTEDLVVEDLNALTIEGYERENSITLIGTTDWTQAQKLAVYNLERSRLNKAYHFIAGPKALPLEQGDCISITHSLPGWTNKLCRIIAMSIAGQNEVSLSVIEEDVALYNDVIDIDVHTYSSTNLPSPFDVPDEVTNLTFIEEEYYNKDVSYTRLQITFTKPVSPFWKHSEVWVNVAGAGYSHYMNATGSFTIEPVKEAVNYKIKLLPVSIHDNKQSISTATEWSYAVIGKNTPPPDVANFKAIPQSDTIILMWDAVDIVDLQGYEIRKGANWAGGIFIGFTRAVVFQLNGVAPGSHSYMLKSIDTNNKYSNNFALATTTVYGPASYTEKMSQYSDYNETGETHDNTERYVDATYGPLLRVLRPALTGTYTSPVYDRGSVVTRRSWPEFDILFFGTGTAWYDQFNATQLWTDKFSGSDTWLTLFGAYIAGILKMRLGYSNDNSIYYWIDYFESYVAETQARYVKYEITITDVAADGRLCVKPTTYKEAYWQ
ncbi:MAG: hypothetical protein UX37_C0016G0015 [Microgenomates group bacterium GW2011_GWA2_46_16]|nr:MAG: hypothetical protein UX37_C0016G0015 [Microgenomates group bacterium GW2011_GWA2_46_16]